MKVMNEITSGPFTIRAHTQRLTFESESALKYFKSFIEKYKDLDNEGLKKLITSCVSCTARKEAIAPVCPEGDVETEFVFVGRNPGREEDRHGKPFYPSAPGGRTLMAYMKSLGLKRGDVYITNAMFCHTERDRLPSSEELYTCSVFKLIEYKILKNARYVFLLGNDAIRQVFGLDFPSVVRIHGNVYQYRTTEGKLMMFFPAYHPGYVLRQMSKFRQEVSDYLYFCRKLVEKDKQGDLKWLV